MMENKKNTIQNIWEMTAKFNICITGVPEGEERENWSRTNL